jgi:hypothetical protein
MLPIVLIIAFAIQSPSPSASHSPPGAAPVPTTDDAALAAFLWNEERYAERLGGVMNKDLRREWARYLDDEQDKARERARGENDEDDAVQTFGAYLDDRYRRRSRPGILLFSIGFAPLGIGLYTGLTLGEAGPGALAIAGVGAASIVAGAVWWGIRGMQRRRFHEARASLDAQGPRARLRWRGVAPLYMPQLRAHGVSVGFAF